MHIPTREPFVAYLLVHAAMLRRRRDVASGAIERLEKHAQALELLATFVRSLPAEDDRSHMLGDARRTRRPVRAWPGYGACIEPIR
jgi:hypothetical protein